MHTDSLLWGGVESDLMNIFCGNIEAEPSVQRMKEECTHYVKKSLVTAPRARRWVWEGSDQY